MTKFIFYLFICLTLPVSAFATVSISAHVNTTHISLEDEVELVITVEGDRGHSTPSIDSIKDFTVLSTGTSNNFSFINGQMSSSKKYIYVLMPLKKGNFTLGPFETTYDGQVFQSNKIELQVTDSSDDASNTSPPYMGQENHPALTNDQAQQIQEKLRPFWISVDISNKSPFVQEQVLYTFRFYTAVEVGRLQLELPKFDDFKIEEVVPEKKYYQNINGQRYLVSEKVFSLFALKSGKLPIEETVLVAEVPDISQHQDNLFNDPFFNFGFRSRSMKTKRLRTKPLTLNVQPLPADQPNGFTGLVGEFQLDTQLSPKTLKVGDSATLTLELKGKGNIFEAYLPKREIVSNDFKVYDDKSKLDLLRTDKGVEGTKTFKKALVPVTDGTKRLNLEELYYFNPSSKNYEPLGMPDFTLLVNPNTDEKLNKVTNNDEKQTSVANPTINIAKDIAPPKDILESPSNVLSILGKVLLFITVIIGPLLSVIALLQKRIALLRSASLSSNQKGAYKTFKKKIATVLDSNSPSVDKCQQILNILKKYLEEKFGEPTGHLTVLDILSMLQSKNISSENISAIKKHLQYLESCLYGKVDQKSQFDGEIMQIIQSVAKIDSEA